MKKRMISIILAVMVCITMSVTTVAYGEDDGLYTTAQQESIYSKYVAQDHMLEEIFANDSDVGYWSMVNSIENNAVLRWSIEKASWIIGELPDKKDYVEILTNLIVMQEYDFAEQVETQSQFDNLKDTDDYINDIIGITTSFIGGSRSLETVSPIIDALSDGKDVIIDSVEQAKYYETVTGCYVQVNDFLDVVYKYVDNEELKSAAGSLLEANKTLLQKRLEYLNDTSESIAGYEAKFFGHNLSFALLKNTDVYQADEAVKWFVDCGEKLKDSILSVAGAGQFVFRMMMLAGDIGFGTSNTFKRYQEMKTISEISEAIVEANNKVQIPDSYQAKNAIGAIKAKCDYYKMLITAHARGEYLNYSLVAHDAGVLSELRGLFDAFKDSNETDRAWYDSQISVMTKYYNILNDVFDVEDIPETEVSNPEELYKPVLDQYRDVIANDFYRYADWIEDYDSPHANEIGMDVNKEILKDAVVEDEMNLCYALADIDLNGVPELFIASTGDYGYRLYQAFSHDRTTYYDLFPDNAFGAFQTWETLQLYDTGIFVVNECVVGIIEWPGDRIHHYCMADNGFSVEETEKKVDLGQDWQFDWIPFDPPAEENDSTNHAKSLYRSMLIQQYEEDWTLAEKRGYALVYIDNDEIPELYVYGSFEAEGDWIYTINQESEVVSLNFNRTQGGSYIERSGLFCNDNGNMGFYNTDIFELKDGEFSRIAGGLRIDSYNHGDLLKTDYYWENKTLHIENGHIVTDEGSIFDREYWEGKALSETEYTVAYNTVFDRSKARQMYKEVNTFQEVMALLS